MLNSSECNSKIKEIIKKFICATYLTIKFNSTTRIYATKIDKIFCNMLSCCIAFLK